jgi:urease accessory protein
MPIDEEPWSGTWLAGLIQTTDTLFPSGGYAHSYGLEEMVALGKIKDKNDLEAFLIGEILPSLADLELPYLLFCQEAAEARDQDELLDLNEEISAWKLTREIREAGHSQGLQMLRMIDQLYPDEWAGSFARELRERSLPCQQITATAILRDLQGVPPSASMTAWVYQAVSNFCSASIKLLRLGEVACQKIIGKCICEEELQTILSRATRVSRDQAGWFNPMLDLASARHELAFSRLFIS